MHTIYLYLMCLLGKIAFLLIDIALFCISQAHLDQINEESGPKVGESLYLENGDVDNVFASSLKKVLVLHSSLVAF